MWLSYNACVGKKLGKKGGCHWRWDGCRARERNSVISRQFWQRQPLLAPDYIQSCRKFIIGFFITFWQHFSYTYICTTFTQCYTIFGQTSKYQGNSESRSYFLLAPNYKSKFYNFNCSILKKYLSETHPSKKFHGMTAGLLFFASIWWIFNNLEKSNFKVISRTWRSIVAF